MHNVNGWMLGLAFLLGLLLTFAMMIRRVSREVPVTHAVAARVPDAKPDAKPDVKKPHVADAVAAAAATGAVAKLHGAVEKVEHAEKSVAKAVHKVAETAGEKVDEMRRGDVIEAVPYGAGSVRVSARTKAPAGYTIKGDKDTGQYFTADSPDYETIEAEVWFVNEESAQKAGFARWDAKGDRPADPVSDAAAAVITEEHAEATTVITEDHSAGDSSLVIVDHGGELPVSTVRVLSEADARAEEAANPYGAGSALAAADGSGPAGWLIKGNANSMLFHGPDSPSYKQTVAEVWFVDEAAATTAGFRRWDTNATK
ncbi:hypothetical protein [Mycolicibacterium sp.]|uniref:channel accessory protein ArfC, sunset domain variant n=1 Tax=Mycolicibacterium sp. TaxID=2320850 RepID=UPI0028ACEB44|nr:hypothetical protein [Mycolicibacterium sp.]